MVGGEASYHRAALRCRDGNERVIQPFPKQGSRPVNCINPIKANVCGTTSTENRTIFDDLQSPVGGSLFYFDSESSKDEEGNPGSKCLKDVRARKPHRMQITSLEST
ncbi:uncharacterized protein LOC121800455 [Salvia splendens]|uniref:uncharacterized protein LOC121800455 n=1 Tax=Salvia splendens TaxID=180675 RepID=UPI001C2556BB|nr:uncharacterized protein LOC121800455 [Salvia splendens]